jgi:ABC-type branched-subunit amino acid transport system ATPase component
VLETGRMVAEGPATALLEDDRLRSAFLGAPSPIPAARQ